MLLLAVLLVQGCRRIANPLGGEKPLAKVGDNELYLDDLRSIFTPGITPEDSVKLLESYVDVWIKKQLKIRQAEKLFSKNAPEIERQVEDYRNSLLTFKLDNYYVAERLDTTFSSKEIADYYIAHRQDFQLDRDMIQGRVVRVPDSFRLKARLKSIMGFATDDDRKDFADMCQKGGLDMREFSQWTDYSEMLDCLPVDKSRPDDKLLHSDGVQELRSDDATYYFIITARRAKGDAVPLEKAEEAIRKILANTRRADVIRACEDSLYNAAMKEKLFVINIK